MSARLLFVGLDAAEAELLERFAADGHCPSLAMMIERGATISMSSSLETLPGAIWPEICTGIGCGQQAQFYHGGQLHTGEAEKRPIASDEVDPALYYWARASRAGRRVFVGDVPHTVPVIPFNGLQLYEYGTHDRHFVMTSEPPSLLQEIRARHGDHPVTACDQHGETQSGYVKLLEGLKRGAVMKAEIFRDHLGRADWDLFNVCFTEGHCAGHQFWHFQDPDHPRHDPGAPAEFRTAIRDVYGRLDAAIGDLIAAAGPDATVMVLASHGMGLYSGGPNLLNEVLARLGLTSEGSDNVRGRFWRTLQFSSNPALHNLRITLKKFIGRRVIQSIQSGSGSLHEPFTRTETRAAAVRNNRCGAIRLNLKGREPIGEVAPGNEAAALTELIRETLMELRHPDTDEPIVDKVMTAREAFGTAHHADVPDILVVFRDDLGVLDTCRSERLGLIRRTVYRHTLPRSGDHRPSSRLWVMNGPFPAGARYASGDVLDVGPTVLDLMGLPVPDDIDGGSLTRLIAGGDNPRRGPWVGPRAMVQAL